MHDSQAEDRLRDLLRAEGDSLSLTITTAELERRLEARRRAKGGRRLSFIAAAVAVIAVAAIVAVPALEVVGTSPSPASSPLSSPAAIAVPTPSTPPIPSRAPLGRPDEAILVRPIGDPVQPTGFEVTRVDPSTGQSTLISTIPEAALPKHLYVSGVPIISRTGWLAIPYNGAANVDGQLPLVLIVDVTNPTAESWIRNGAGQLSWTADEQLGLYSASEIYLVDPLTQTQSFITMPERTYAESGQNRGVVWSTDPGTLLLARRGAAEEPDWGSIDTSGAFIPATDLPAAYQRTGLERLAGAAAHSVGQPCSRFGSASPADCSLVESDATGTRVATRLAANDTTSPFDDVWAADGRGLWLLTTDAATGTTVATLGYSPADDRRTEIARISLPESAPGPAILGLSDETAPGSALVAVGDQAGHVYAFVMPGGSVTSQDGSAWFAGWADDQPAYDPD